MRHCHAAPSVELPVCVAERYLTLRIRGYMGAHLASCGRKNPLPFPLSERSPVSDLHQTINKGKVGVQRGRETVGVPSFLPLRRVPRRPRRRRRRIPHAEVQRKTPRPLGANTLTQFAHPGQSVQKKGAAQTGRTACAVRVPQKAGAL